MDIYSIDIRITATAYIRASSEAHARTLANGLTGDCLEVAGVGQSEVAISGLPFDHPELPDVSLSPAMTIWGAQGVAEIAQDNANRTEETAEAKAARAVDYLRQARDLLKGAGAIRAVDRVRLAITSAGGAVRHAQGKASRAR